MCKQSFLLCEETMEGVFDEDYEYDDRQRKIMYNNWHMISEHSFS